MAVTTEPRAATDRPVRRSGPMTHCHTVANLAVIVFKLTVNRANLLSGYPPEVQLKVVLEAERETELIDVRAGITAKLVDRKLVTVSTEAPMQYALELFGNVCPSD
ncbi:H(+)/Cl(-) exchange transporter 5-like protein 2 [Colletotrichum sojae]|uniref:H(+)/Cl(-) exchange transporter 5-like protein 2 n=1 Tax=Colletotrichum sojae TaxID=2175907 RepID=A0A8H6MPB4_9PEZI|nr:H(+)/Cl(-) exchange transporter 5-like protein 2 [Colletotrichum sojae]